MRALWSAGWASAVTAYFTVGAAESPMMVGIMVAAVFLGFVLGAMLRRRDSLVGGWISAFALTVIAILVWIDAFDAFAFVATIAAVIASAGYVLGAPAKSSLAPTRVGRILTPVLRGIALAIVVLATGAAASMHIGFALILAAALTLAWALSSFKIPGVKLNGRRNGVNPIELLQGVLIATGLGGWTALVLIILPEVGPAAPWPAINEGAIPVAVTVAVGMLGAGIGFGLVRPLVEAAHNPRSAWVLGPVVIGMLLLMMARPGSLAVVGFIGVALVAAMAAVTFRLASTQVEEPATEETIYARTASPALLATLALGAILCGMLAAVAEDRDVVLLPVVAIAVASTWIDLRRAVSR